MAKLASKEGVPQRTLVIEASSRNTWENIHNSLPHLAGMDAVFIASDSLHVHRARQYLCRQSPELCSKTYAATSYRPFQFFWLKWAGAWGNLISLCKDRKLG